VRLADEKISMADGTVHAKMPFIVFDANASSSRKVKVFLHLPVTVLAGKSAPGMFWLSMMTLF